MLTLPSLRGYWGCNPCFAFLFSCLTNVRENISYKLEYQLCETRSIRTSTSITLKRKKDKLSSSSFEHKKSLDAYPQFKLYVSKRKRLVSTQYSHSQLSPAFAKPRLPWKFRKASALKGPEGTTQKALKPRSASVSLCGPCCLSNTLLGWRPNWDGLRQT